MHLRQVSKLMQAKWTASVLLIALLSACTTVPVSIRFPEAPQELFKPCPTLAQADPADPRLSNLLTVVVENYATYYDCKSVANGWQQWYQDQQRVFNEAMK